MKIASTLVAIALFLCTSSMSSPVEQVTFKRLAFVSEFIFEGKAVDVQSKWNDDRSVIHTYVTFRVDDVVKGNVREGLVLRFLGGKVGEIALEVSDSTLPKLGEEGIYFVEQLDHPQINPFYGADQGHFLIIPSNQQRVMTTRSRQIITGFFPDVKEDKPTLSNGIALGLSVEASNLPPAGVTTFQFKQKIREYFQDR